MLGLCLLEWMDGVAGRAGWRKSGRGGFREGLPKTVASAVGGSVGVGRWQGLKALA